MTESSRDAASSRATRRSARRGLVPMLLGAILLVAAPFAYLQGAERTVQQPQPVPTVRVASVETVKLAGDTAFAVYAKPDDLPAGTSGDTVVPACTITGPTGAAAFRGSPGSTRLATAQATGADPGSVDLPGRYRLGMFTTGAEGDYRVQCPPYRAVELIDQRALFDQQQAGDEPAEWVPIVAGGLAILGGTLLLIGLISWLRSREQGRRSR